MAQNTNTNFAHLQVNNGNVILCPQPNKSKMKYFFTQELKLYPTSFKCHLI